MYFIRSLFISELSSSLTQTHAWEKRDKSGARDWHAHTTMYKIDNQQGPTISTGNSTQYSVITYMRKESEKEWIYVYIYNWNYFDVHLKLTHVNKLYANKIKILKKGESKINQFINQPWGLVFFASHHHSSLPSMPLSSTGHSPVYPKYFHLQNTQLCPCHAPANILQRVNLCVQSWISLLLGS